MPVGHEELEGRLDPPSWVGRLLAEAVPHEMRVDARGGVVTHRRNGRYQCVSVRVPRARLLAPLEFQRATVEAYRAIRRALADGPSHPIRFWNFIPAIGRRVDEHMDWYMVFNAGRHAAYMDWYGQPAATEWNIATASGVGHRGDDLVIHALASTKPGEAVENPRQIPAYRYSRCYGPFSPSFSRATILPSGNGTPDQLLLGGTASIRGEQSRHLANLRRQTDETLTNLGMLIRHAALSQLEPGANGNGNPHGHLEVDRSPWLALLRTVRIYYVHEEHRRHLADLLNDAFTEASEQEWIRADLCRPELLVEIEGLAELTFPMMPATADDGMVHRGGTG
jgi:chorismate lyase / 3-hydroxybenzoate synthase